MLQLADAKHLIGNSQMLDDGMQGVKSTAECQQAARSWAYRFSEQEGKFAVNMEATGDLKQRVAPGIHMYSGAAASLNGKPCPPSAQVFESFSGVLGSHRRRLL